MTKHKADNWEKSTGALATSSFVFSIFWYYPLTQGFRNTIEILVALLPVVLFLIALIAGSVAHNLKWALLSSSVVYCAWGASMGILGVPIILIYKLGMDGLKLVPYSLGVGLTFFFLTKLFGKSLLNQKMQSTQNDAQPD